MDAQSAGAILRILNLIALADGNLSLEEEELLDDLSQQHQLQARLIAWEDQLENPNSIRELANLITPEYRQLTLKTAQMVAGVSRLPADDVYICAEEQQLLDELQQSLSLSEPDARHAIEEAELELQHHPNLWQVLFGCFGSQFDWPLLPG